MIYKKLELPDLGEKIIPETTSEIIVPLLEEEPQEIEQLTQKEQPIDLDTLQQTAYQNGFEDCAQKLQPIIDELNNKNSLHELLKLKLLEITSFELEEKYKSQLTKFIIEIINQLAQKLYLSCPVNFQSMLQDKILNTINNHHKTGLIEIKAHPNNLSYVQEFIENDKFIPDNTKNFKIIPDETLGNNDCVLKWESNSFEFKISAVEKEINDILEQFKTISI